LGLLTCKNYLPYNLYYVGGNVKHCAIQSNAWFTGLKVASWNLLQLVELSH